MDRDTRTRTSSHGRPLNRPGQLPLLWNHSEPVGVRLHSQPRRSTAQWAWRPPMDSPEEQEREHARGPIGATMPQDLPDERDLDDVAPPGTERRAQAASREVTNSSSQAGAANGERLLRRLRQVATASPSHVDELCDQVDNIEGMMQQVEHDITAVISMLGSPPGENGGERASGFEQLRQELASVVGNVRTLQQVPSGYVARTERDEVEQHGLNTAMEMALARVVNAAQESWAQCAREIAELRARASRVCGSLQATQSASDDVVDQSSDGVHRHPEPALGHASESGDNVLISLQQRIAEVLARPEHDVFFVAELISLLVAFEQQRSRSMREVMDLRAQATTMGASEHILGGSPQNQRERELDADLRISAEEDTPSEVSEPEVAHETADASTGPILIDAVQESRQSGGVDHTQLNEDATIDELEVELETIATQRDRLQSHLANAEARLAALLAAQPTNEGPAHGHDQLILEPGAQAWGSDDEMPALVEAPQGSHGTYGQRRARRVEAAHGRSLFNTAPRNPGPDANVDGLTEAQAWVEYAENITAEWPSEEIRRWMQDGGAEESHEHFTTTFWRRTPTRTPRLQRRRCRCRNWYEELRAEEEAEDLAEGRSGEWYDLSEAGVRALEEQGIMVPEDGRQMAYLGEDFVQRLERAFGHD
ncbi:hypothetical protein LTR85_003934 [Meristemomyces frigidus]|nr:hypothetical protein LTR85_003934 [Meristemomyces frigidus]